MAQLKSGGIKNPGPPFGGRGRSGVGLRHTFDGVFRVALPSVDGVGVGFGVAALR
jgi:hypothetical protein